MLTSDLDLLGLVKKRDFKIFANNKKNYLDYSFLSHLSDFSGFSDKIYYKLQNIYIY